ncbi:SPW_0924 family protein [Streptomyces sp. NPDC001034]|uniref:SPW_0924 family protein n=1 Tax=Streptomyces sp. NPDC001034 TaxID=3154375 RepID=UPI00331DE4C6
MRALIAAATGLVPAFALVLAISAYVPRGSLTLGLLLLALSPVLETLARRPADPAPTATAEPEPVSA